MRITWKGYYAIVVSDKIVRFLGYFVSLGKEAMAITLFPFIFIRTNSKENDELVRHETIHIRQQLELLIIGALFLYVIEYAYARYIKKLGKRSSYYYTALEQEAHRNAMNPLYLKERKPYAVFAYIKDKKMLSRSSTGTLVVNDYV